MGHPLDKDVGGPSPLWEVPTLGGEKKKQKKTGRASQEEPAREQCFSLVLASRSRLQFPALPFLDDGQSKVQAK